MCDAFTETRKEDAAGKEGVALEKVIGAELKRQFRELFPCKGKFWKYMRCSVKTKEI